MFTTDSAVSERIIQTFANSCARLMKNTAKYKRNSDGSFPWAWTGRQVVARLTIEEERYFRKIDALPTSPKVYEEDTQYPLVINGKLVGYVWLWVPYAYDDCILYLELVPEMAYDNRVVRRFAMFDGYKDPTFDLARLTVMQSESVTETDLIFL